MQWVKFALVRALLLKTVIKTFSRQLYLKLTKITRRSKGPKGFCDKFAAGYDFLVHVAHYNWEVIQCSQRCLLTLAAENIQTAFIYGETDVKEVLYDLTFEIPVRVSGLGEDYEIRRNLGWNELPIEMNTMGREKIIVASLVTTEERVRRLRELGVDAERIVLLR